MHIYMQTLRIGIEVLLNLQKKKNPRIWLKLQTNDNLLRVLKEEKIHGEKVIDILIVNYVNYSKTILFKYMTFNLKSNPW